MESNFRIIFWTGLAGCAGWFWFAMLQTVTPLVEAAGVSAGALLLIGASGLLYFWIPQVFDLKKVGAEKVTEKVSKLAEEAVQEAKSGSQTFTGEVLAKAKPWQWAVAAGVALVLTIGWVSMQSAQQVKADLANLTGYVRAQCASWINDEFNHGNVTRSARASNSWRKGEYIVVDVTWKDSSVSKSWSSRLCVYDPDTGRLQSPGAFGRGRWEKP